MFILSVAEPAAFEHGVDELRLNLSRGSGASLHLGDHIRIGLGDAFHLGSSGGAVAGKDQGQMSLGIPGGPLIQAITVESLTEWPEMVMLLGALLSKSLPIK